MNITKILLTTAITLSSITIEALEAKRLSLNVEGAIGINSNPTLENSDLTQSQTTETRRGKKQNSILSNSDTETQFSGSIQYKAVKTDSFTMHAKYEFMGDQFTKNSYYNLLAHTLTTPLNYYTDSYRFELIPNYSYLTRDNSQYLSSYGSEVRATSRFESVDVTIFSTLFKTDALDPNFSYMTSTLLSLGPELLLNFESSQLSLSGAITKNKAHDEADYVTSYNGFFSTLDYSYTSQRWDHKLSLGYEVRNYIADPNNGTKKKDTIGFLRYKPSYEVSNGFTLFIDLKYVNNNANIKTNSYDQFISLIGISWSAF